MPIKVYVSCISGNKEVKKRQQRVLMILDSKNLKYDVIDITEPGREDDKEFMQNNSKSPGATIGDPNPRHPLPPQLFNDNEYCGDYDQFDLANELDNLEEFLKVEAPTNGFDDDKKNIVKENGELALNGVSKETTPDHISKSKEPTPENNSKQPSPEKTSTEPISGNKSKESSPDKDINEPSSVNATNEPSTEKISKEPSPEKVDISPETVAEPKEAAPDLKSNRESVEKEVTLTQGKIEEVSQSKEPSQDREEKEKSPSELLIESEKNTS